MHPPEGSLKELQTSQVGDLEVVLLAPAEALARGQGFALLEFRDGNGMLVDVGTVWVTATMPMPGASAMSGASEIKPTPAPGPTRWPPISAWRACGYLQVEWNGPAGRGSASREQGVQRAVSTSPGRPEGPLYVPPVPPVLAPGVQIRDGPAPAASASAVQQFQKRRDPSCPPSASVAWSNRMWLSRRTGPRRSLRSVASRSGATG